MGAGHFFFVVIYTQMSMRIHTLCANAQWRMTICRVPHEARYIERLAMHNAIGRSSHQISHWPSSQVRRKWVHACRKYKCAKGVLWYVRRVVGVNRQCFMRTYNMFYPMIFLWFNTILQLSNFKSQMYFFTLIITPLIYIIHYSFFNISIFIACSLDCTIKVVVWKRIQLHVLFS